MAGNATTTREPDPTAFLAATDEQLSLARERRDELNDLIEGLETARAAVSRHVLSRAIGGTPSDTSSNSRIEVIEEILKAAAGPMTNEELLAALERRGLSVDSQGLSQSLTYAKRRGIAKSVTRGQWAIVKKGRTPTTIVAKKAARPRKAAAKKATARPARAAA